MKNERTTERKTELARYIPNPELRELFKWQPRTRSQIEALDYEDCMTALRNLGTIVSGIVSGEIGVPQELSWNRRNSEAYLIEPPNLEIHPEIHTQN